MKKFIKLFCVCFLCLITIVGLFGCNKIEEKKQKTEEQIKYEKWLNDIENDEDKEWVSHIKFIGNKYNPYEGNCDTVFYGASNFAQWRSTMGRDFGDYVIQNHAFGGSTDKDLVYWAKCMLYDYNPSVIFLQTGSNDYVECKETTEEGMLKEVVEYKQFMYEAFHEKLPNAKIVVVSGLLLPGKAEYTTLTMKVNDWISKYCGENDYMYYIDCEDFTYDFSTDTYYEDMFVNDKIHFTNEARQRWAKEYLIPCMEEIGCVKK